MLQRKIVRSGHVIFPYVALLGYPERIEVRDRDSLVSRCCYRWVVK